MTRLHEEVSGVVTVEPSALSLHFPSDVLRLTFRASLSQKLIDKSVFFPDRDFAPGAVQVQEAAYSEPGEQLPADAAVTFRRADRPDPAGAERQPSGVPAGGAGRVSAAEAQRPGGGGGRVQHAAVGSQRAALEGG